MRTHASYPGEWGLRDLGSICLIQIGGTPSRDVLKYWAAPSDPTGLPWVSIGDLTTPWIEHTKERITEAGARNSNVKLVRQGTTLMSFKLSIGKMARAGSDLYTNEAIAAFEPQGEDLDPNYLFHALPGVLGDLVVDQAVKGATLNKKKLARISLPLPQRLEQARIAEVLDTFDVVMESSRVAIAKRHMIAEGLTQSLLSYGVDEGGECRNPQRNPDHFKTTRLGLLPKTWEVMKLCDTAKRETGSTVIGPFGSNLVATDYRPQGVPVVFVRDIREAGFQWKSHVYLDPRKAAQLEAHQVLPGDLVITKMGLPPCVASIYPSWMPPGVITADVIRLRPDPGLVTSEWLTSFINSAPVRRQVGWITGGVTRPKVTLKDFRTLLVAVPPMEEQLRIVAVLRAVGTTLEIEEEVLHQLQMTKAGLVKDLLSGRVRTSPN